ncbi:hypothetical protein WN944_022726 [Citrus x changshan-huyou]|uniref:Uncharacterized protein n=1 Tax=Citrus x changshan-huyou TaxID=2935761 RepID=A0AAP0N3T1_9ROSI
MLSLAPTRLINVEIISIVAEMLSTLQKFSDKGQCYSWFLPVLNAAVSEKGVLQRWVEENVALGHEIIDLHTCKRIWSSSDEERLRLILLLVHFENNAVKKKVMESASIYYIETEIDGVKRDNGLAKKLRTNRMRSKKMGHGPRK